MYVSDRLFPLQLMVDIDDCGNLNQKAECSLQAIFA